MAEKRKHKFLEFGEKSRTELLAEKLTLGVSAVLFIASLFPTSVLAINLLSMFAVVFAAYPGVEDLFEDLTKKRFSEAWIMVIAVCASMICSAMTDGNFRQAAAIAILYRVLKWLQAFTVRMAKADIRSLDSSAGESAHLIVEEGGTESIDADMIEKGMALRILPHEVISVDCIITDGKCVIEMPSAEGKTVPRIFNAGDKLKSGMINGSSTISVEALENAADSSVRKISDIMDKAAESESGFEEKAGNILKYVSAAIAVAAAAAAVIGSLVTGYTGTWMMNAIVIVTASLASSVLSVIPAAFIRGIACGAKNGTIIRNSAAAEKIAESDTVVFDNPGMLASQKQTAGDVFAIPGYSEDDILSLVSEYADKAGNDVLKEIAGSAIKRTQTEEKIFCCDGDTMKEQGIDISSLPQASLYVSVDGKAVGCMQIVKEAGDKTKSLIKALKSIGIRNTILLSADENDGSDKFFLDAGINQCIYGVKDKKSALEKIKSGKHKVIYLSDKTDLPKITDAKVVFGDAAADMPESADVIVASAETDAVPAALKLGRNTVRTAGICTGIIAAIKLAVIVLAFLSLVPVYISFLAETAAMVICVIVTFCFGRVPKSAHSK